jgi:hypothetical protein
MGGFAGAGHRSVDHMADEEAVQVTPDRRVVRLGDTVRRPARPWTPAVHALLTYLEDVGFPYSPRVLGIDETGREILTYVDGASGPQGWGEVVGDAGLTTYARLQMIEQVRRLAAAGREPQVRWVGEGYLDDLCQRVAWSHANRHLFD